ncbi:hypothetical protein [Actinoplanes sp. NBRC 103695]|uniref:hypothetical protein n=1 Tax=Actinoplanes sp. NBRC 103695 TaxID=3032202 RepID=UPI0024A5214B|nr:hypothetical protein [Actinoplanes sp. NBRC 103695]GLY99562.1 hypothetical protein Acsp02_68150 [Actinoplanes sp. NBRC 103695]
MTGLGKGEFRLHAAVRPPVTAGDHTVRLGHRIEGVGEVAPVTAHFAVTAPQFGLAATEVQSVYPPHNSEGGYDTRLPQVALLRRTLPWEREATAGDPQRRPWLALVVLTDAEATLRTGRPVTEAVPPALHARLKIRAESGTCDHLEVSPAVVARTFPRPDELAWLCHVREVAVGDTELAGADEDGQLAVVVSARLPRAPAGEKLAYGAYLISLEHRLDVLPTTTGDPVDGLGPMQATPGGGPPLRFPVLFRFRFTVTGSGDFQSIMENLDSGSLGTAPDGCPPVTPTGHVAIAHRTRRGEEAAAWYRGPLVPRPVVRGQAGAPLFAADQGRAIAADGLEDLSVAAAFETGRLLALSDPRFLAELATWRRHTMAAATLAATLPKLPGVTSLGIDPSGAGRLLAQALLKRMAADPVAAFGGIVPIVDTPPGFLDPADAADIATGLGLDLAVVDRILRDAPVGTTRPAPPAVPALETDFQTLADHPELLKPLRAELRRYVEALAEAAGLDPAHDTFDPSFAPSTIPDLYG